jgi:hypothetical protein
MPQQPELPAANPPTTPASQVPRISVLAEQAGLIETQKLRLRRLLAGEDMTGKYSREASALIERLWVFYASHFEIQQELGLEPAYRRGPRPETAPPEEVVRHPLYPFLSSDEARDLFVMEELAKQGKINLVEVYKLGGAVNDYKEQQEAERGHHQ